MSHGVGGPAEAMVFRIKGAKEDGERERRLEKNKRSSSLSRLLHRGGELIGVSYMKNVFMLPRAR